MDVLPSYVGFMGQDAPSGTQKPTTQWPVQKFMWNDYQVNPGDSVSYQVTAMLEQDENLDSLKEGPSSGWTPTQVVESAGNDGMYAYFNRGVLACQWIARNVKGDQAQSIQKAIATPNDKVRNFLSGHLREQLLGILNDTQKSGGQVYAALFELDDPELLSALVALEHRAHVILANGAVKRKGQDENAAAREKLKNAGVDVVDRMIAPEHLGHNKFLVICDTNGTPQAAWSGSTNWTMTGLCTQANNGILIRNPQVASVFRQQWTNLRVAGDGFPPSLFAANDQEKVLATGGSQLDVWFTSTKGQVDLKSAGEIIMNANRGILFLMFMPGPSNQSLLGYILKKKQQDPSLFLHGIINQDPSSTKTPVEFFHRGYHQTADFDVLLPYALPESFGYWTKEIPKLPKAHAIVHSKVIVIDPFTSHPVVMTGSHNFSPTASSKNDENLIMVENNSPLAAEYAVNVMTVYSHYRFAFFRSKLPSVQNWNGLSTNDQWQHGYFSGEKQDELNFWMGR
jgi:phosphatidylserine/phosphatidylglycerophosphate/cardiolipin synthase-like enzyme